MAKLEKKSSELKTQAGTLCWYFHSTDHGENDGFSDSLLEYFQGAHERYVAREAIQNSVDARDDYGKPVSVVFEKFSMPATALPGREELLSRLNRCLAFVRGQE